MFVRLLIVLCSLLLFDAACPSQIRGSQPPATTEVPHSLATTANTMIDACSLIDKSEIESVQKVKVQHKQPTSQKYGDLDISQCYYTAISSDGSKNLSVYLQVIYRDAKSARPDAVKQFWREKLQRESSEKRREESEEGEEEAIKPPVSVYGIGDKAYWLASDRGGALYVLKKDKLVRVSVGGEYDVKTQMEKTKTLAKKTIARLR